VERSTIITEALARDRPAQKPISMPWSRLVLILLLLFDVWYRAHTFGPTLRDAVGVSLWPSAVGESEPLDCDEAAYAYIGHRILRGDVMYRDLTENKPPLGYWLYALAVAIGGYRELTIRVMPIPFVLATIAMVWWITQRLGGAGAACVAAGLYVVLSTDPFLFGNGANLEHFINFFSVAALALFLSGWNRVDRWALLGSGACLGAAALVKQVAIAPVVVFVVAIMVRSWKEDGPWQARLRRCLLDMLAFGIGLILIVAVAAVTLIATGAGRSAFEDIFRYGKALATDTVRDPNAPSGWIRWLTGNADPSGRLPWPFGTTDYLVWWGEGSWPLWLASIPATADLLLGPYSTAPRRLVACWTLAAWAQVALPGLYWPHYYLLPIAGVAISVAVALADAAGVFVRTIRWRSPTPANTLSGAPAPRAVLLAASATLVLGAAIGTTLFLQTRHYLWVPPEELTIRFKGGRQWVVLRAMGRELARRATIRDQPRLYVWGWQSPLHFYGRLDSPTRHFFVDNLLRDQADRHHPLIQPRTEEILATLRRRPPELIFTGYRPFRSLRAFLDDGYLPSRLAPGLWVKRDDYGRFETAGDRGPASAVSRGRGSR
jgi:4-amino-4-deoxy-L-arabinose transferase-like glycosyltransferase